MTVTAPRVAPRKLGYQPSLDGLRAVSVLAVILYHADFALLPGGFLGVEVFFVVSGFLITSLLLEERLHSGRIDLKQFWIRRARRLLPALYLLLAVVSAASILVYTDAAGRMGGDVLAALAYVSNWWNIFLNESYFAQAGRPPLLRHLWSLAVEEQFYLLFPPIFAWALYKFGKGKARVGLIVLAIASAVEMAILFEPYTDPSRVYYGTDTRLAGLLVGAVLALSWTPWRSTQAAARRAGPALDTIGVVGLVALGWYLTRVNEFDPFIYRGGFLLLDVICIIVIAVLVHPAARLSKVLAWGPLVWIGLRSYAIYLWHWPIFQVTRPELDLPFSGFPVFVLRMVLTFGAAELSYRYVEQPLRKGVLGDWWHDVRASVGPRRTALARRGLAVGGVFVVLLVMLTIGLRSAATSSERDSLELASMTAPGLDGSTPDAIPGVDTVDTTTAPTSTGASTTTTDPTATTTTVAGQTTVAPTTAAPPTTLAPGTTNAVAVGDSVMLGAAGAIHTALPGVRIDAKVARQFDTVIDVVAWYEQEGLIPGPLIVHAGTNGAFSDADLDRLFEIAGERKVLLVNAKVSRPWQDLVNQRLAAAAQRHPNAVLVDWFTLSSQHPEWFANDGAHLRPDGTTAFAQLLADSL
ncbi:MAG: acyltransferase family protein [Microthrixaceae bacterium]